MRLVSNRSCYRVSLLPTLGHFEVEPSGSRLLNMFSPKQIRSQVRRLDAKNWGFSTFRTFFRPDSTFSAGLAVKGSSFFPFILSVTYFFGFKNRSKTCPASILPVFNDHHPIWSLILPLASFSPSKNPSRTFPRVVFSQFSVFLFRFSVRFCFDIFPPWQPTRSTAISGWGRQNGWQCFEYAPLYDSNLLVLGFGLVHGLLL